LPVLPGIGAKQLAQRIVDLDAVDAEYRADDQREENDARQNRLLNGDQADPLQSEGDARHRPLLDFLDVNLSLGVLFEHALSNSHRLNSAGDDPQRGSVLKTACPD